MMMMSMLFLTLLDFFISFRCCLLFDPLFVWYIPCCLLLPSLNLYILSLCYVWYTGMKALFLVLIQWMIFVESVEAQASLLKIQGESFPPRFTHVFSSDKILDPGTRMSLKCEATGSPLPQITWTLDGSSLSEHSRLRVGDYVTNNGYVNSFVNMTNVRIEDSGVYSCTGMMFNFFTFISCKSLCKIQAHLLSLILMPRCPVICVMLRPPQKSSLVFKFMPLSLTWSLFRSIYFNILYLNER